MFGFNPFRRPRSSYQHPVPLVLVDPDEQADHVVCFNRQWLPYVLGALRQLTLETSWKSDDKAAIAAQLDRSNLLISLFIQGCPPDDTFEWEDDDMTMRQTGCKLEQQCPDGSWYTVYDPTACIEDIVKNTAAQPDGGGAIPEGETKEYCATLDANGRWLFPAAVLPGDTVTITEAKGAWFGDGSTQNWRCPDGGNMFLGVCTGGFLLEAPAGWPLPGANKMRLIACYGDICYDAYNTSFVIPLTAPVWDLAFQANDDNLTDNAGGISFCVTVAHPIPTFDDFSGMDWVIPLDFETIDYSALMYIQDANGNVPKGYVVGEGLSSGPSGNHIAADLRLHIAGGYSEVRAIVGEVMSVYSTVPPAGSFRFAASDNTHTPTGVEDIAYPAGQWVTRRFDLAAGDLEINPGYDTWIRLEAYGSAGGQSDTNVTIRKAWLAGTGVAPGPVHA